ncbi:hypothetical protein GQ42DRAFT_162588 [Ramicandelaber brevisporus]|nr:hypothetical protein GQ42DRAFT_162588 [Ramicandelaber brevisporus]
MFHLFTLPLSWFVPSSVGFLPHLLLAVVGRRLWLRWLSALCSPVAVAMLFFFLVRFCSVLFGSCHPYTVSLAISILARRKPGSL